MNSRNITREIFTTTLYHTLGIVPLTSARQDCGRILNAMSGDEARKAKRKFRKQWRKIAKKLQTLAKNPHAHIVLQRRLGIGDKAPDKSHLAARKSEVMKSVNEAVNRLIRETHSR